MPENIQVTVSVAEVEGTLACKKIEIDIKGIMPDENRKFLATLFPKLNPPLYGYYHGGAIWYLGDDEHVKNVIYEISNSLNIDVQLSKPFTVFFRNDLDIHRKVLTRLFEV
ncbi:MAG: hypothetical protein ACTSQY_05385 [Candidatus Odinarchaeia archaeon]